MKDIASLLKDWIERDRVISQRLTLSSKRVALRRLAALGAHLGDGWLWLAGSAIALALGSPATRWLVLWLAVTVLCSVSLGSVIKYLLRRPRPVELGGFYSRRLDSYSFPSGPRRPRGLYRGGPGFRVSPPGLPCSCCMPAWWRCAASPWASTTWATYWPGC